MGATTFITVAQGKTAKDAFSEAVRVARHFEGHGGYTGTIAEKSSFVTIVCPKGVEPQAHVKALLDTRNSPVDDTWGPAGCIDLKDGSFMFFGWASI